MGDYCVGSGARVSLNDSASELHWLRRNEGGSRLLAGDTFYGRIGNGHQALLFVLCCIARKASSAGAAAGPTAASAIPVSAEAQL